MLGERIKKVREIKKITAKQLSIDLNITEKTLSNYENNKIKPSYHLLDYLNKKLNVNINWLLTGQGEIFMSEEKIKNKVTKINIIDANIDNKYFREEIIENILNKLNDVTNNKLLDYIDTKVLEIIKKHNL